MHFVIKKMNGWTSNLYRAIDEDRINTNTTIFIYGVSGTPSVNYERYQNILLIGGGVGVTPLSSVCMHLMKKYESSSHQVKLSVYLVW